MQTKRKFMLGINDAEWNHLIDQNVDKTRQLEIVNQVLAESKKGKVFPIQDDWFSALNLCPLAKVKVVILGQDPYHREGQAHGLSFSVRPGVKTPPSLKNIYKELESDLGCAIPSHGFLQSWAKQGVLLLNACFTVREGEAGSHQKIGWLEVSDAIIKGISDSKENIVFILWGAYAQKKASLIDGKKHLIIEGLHPSPLSAHRGFFGQKYFSRTNSYLNEKNKQSIEWQLPLSVE